MVYVLGSEGIWVMSRFGESCMGVRSVRCDLCGVCDSTLICLWLRSFVALVKLGLKKMGSIRLNLLDPFLYFLLSRLVCLSNR